MWGNDVYFRIVKIQMVPQTFSANVIGGTRSIPKEVLINAPSGNMFAHAEDGNLGMPLAPYAAQRRFLVRDVYDVMTRENKKLRFLRAEIVPFMWQHPSQSITKKKSWQSTQYWD